MLEQNNENTQQKLENEINTILSGEARRHALDFVSYLRTSGMIPLSDNPNRFTYMGAYTCILLFFKHPDFPCGYWGIYDCPIREYDGFPLDENLKEFARANVNICQGKCGCPKPRGGNQMVFGKEFEGVCASVVAFHSPDAEAVEKVKKLMEYWKLIIADSKKK